MNLRSLALALSLAASAPAQQVLFDQQQLVTDPGAGLNLWDVSRGTANLPLGSLVNNSPVSRVADDFTVNDPAGWHIRQLRLWMYQDQGWNWYSPPPVSDLHVGIWDGPPNDPSSTLVSGGLSPVSSIQTSVAEILRIESNWSAQNPTNTTFVVEADVDVLLPAGSYWIELSVEIAAFPGWHVFYAPTNPGVPGNARTTLDAWATSNVLSEGLPIQILGDSAGLGNNVCFQNCLNSTGQPGIMSASGSSVAADNNLELQASQLPPGQFGFFITNDTFGLVPTPTGSCFCLGGGGSVGRYLDSVAAIPSDGVLQYTADLTQTPNSTGTISVLAGQTRYFQAWHRDLATVFPMPGSQFTDVLEIQFQ